MVTLHNTQTIPALDLSVVTTLKTILTTPVENSMYARLYGCYARPDTAAVAYDWDTRTPWMSLLQDIRDHYSIRW